MKISAAAIAANHHLFFMANEARRDNKCENDPRLQQWMTAQTPPPPPPPSHVVSEGAVPIQTGIVSATADDERRRLRLSERGSEGGSGRSVPFSRRVVPFRPSRLPARPLLLLRMTQRPRPDALRGNA